MRTNSKGFETNRLVGFGLCLIALIFAFACFGCTQQQAAESTDGSARGSETAEKTASASTSTAGSGTAPAESPLFGNWNIVGFAWDNESGEHRSQQCTGTLTATADKLAIEMTDGQTPITIEGESPNVNDRIVGFKLTNESGLETYGLAGQFIRCMLFETDEGRFAMLVRDYEMPPTNPLLIYFG